MILLKISTVVTLAIILWAFGFITGAAYAWRSMRKKG